MDMLCFMFHEKVLPRLTDEKDLSRQTDETKQTRTILISVIVVLIVIIICCSKKGENLSFIFSKLSVSPYLHGRALE